MRRLPEKGHFRIDEVADYFDVSRWTIRREIDEGRIEAVKIRRQWRISRAAILEYEAAYTQISTH